MDTQDIKNNSLVESQLILRNFAGILGVTFPFILAGFGFLLFDRGIQPSLSYYYHTEMEDVFVGVLFAIGVTLGVYKSYNLDDDVARQPLFRMLLQNAGRLAGIAAIVVALFPTNEVLGQYSWISITHYVATTLFFISLIFFTYFIFPVTNAAVPPEQRKRLNFIYKYCGRIMILCIVLAGIAFVLPYISEIEYDENSRHLFYFESIAIIAFGYSWLRKVKSIYDQEGRESDSEEERDDEVQLVDSQNDLFNQEEAKRDKPEKVI